MTIVIKKGLQIRVTRGVQVNSPLDVWMAAAELCKYGEPMPDVEIYSDIALITLV